MKANPVDPGRKQSWDKHVSYLCCNRARWHITAYVALENTTKEFISSRVLPWECNNEKKHRGAVYGSVKISRIVKQKRCDRGQTWRKSWPPNTFLNSGRFTIDMTTGKLNCVSKQRRQSPVKSGGNFRCDGMTARLLFPPRSRTCVRFRRLKRGVNNHVYRRGWRVKEGLGIGCCARDRSCVILLWERTVLRSWYWHDHLTPRGPEISLKGLRRVKEIALFYVRGRDGDRAAKCGGVMTQGFRCCFRNLAGI